jgi:hypothetical protein
MNIKLLTGKELQADSVKMVKANWTAEDKKFYEKSGFLTAFGHSCGYMDSFHYGPGGHGVLTLSYISSCYHIAYSDPAYHYKRETFNSRPEAKKRFLQLRKELKEKYK